MSHGRLPPEQWYPSSDPSITVRRVALATGISLRVLECGPAAGPPLLLIHGWAVTAYLWRHQVAALGAAGARVVAIDLPGHGLSDAPEAAGSYTLGEFAAHVGALLDALGIARATIGAQSMGGKIAVRLAFDAPDRVARLFLFGPVGYGDIVPWQMLAPFVPVLPGAIPSLLVPRRIVEFVQRRVHGKLSGFSERDIDEYWAPTQFPETVRAQLQMLREFDWAPWTTEQLATLRTPTHVLFGTRDRTVRPVHAERLAAALPDGALTWIEDGGHVVMEEVPGRVNALILGGLGLPG